MNVLPSQKLSISHLFLSLAAGLMFFLLPNDAKNQLRKLSKDNIALIDIIRKLHKNDEVADYASKVVKRNHPELFFEVAKCLNQNDFGENH